MKLTLSHVCVSTSCIVIRSLGSTFNICRIKSLALSLISSHGGESNYKIESTTLLLESYEMCI